MPGQQSHELFRVDSELRFDFLFHFIFFCKKVLTIKIGIYSSEMLF